MLDDVHQSDAYLDGSCGTNALLVSDAIPVAAMNLAPVINIDRDESVNDLGMA